MRRSFLLSCLLISAATTVSAQFHREFYPGPANNLQIADFNRDGHQDIYLGDIVRLNDGHGGFSTVVPVTANYSGDSVHTLADFNGDGYPDILSCINDSTVTLFLNQHGTSFQRSSFQFPACGPLAVADFNNDGKQDFVLIAGAVTSTGQHWYANTFLGTGTGQFAAPVSTEFVIPEDDPANDVLCNPMSITAADYQGMGRYDLVLRSHCNHDFVPNGGNASYLKNLGQGSFGPAVLIEGVKGFPSAYARLANLNGDVLPDLYFSNMEDYPFGNGDTTAFALLSRSGGPPQVLALVGTLIDCGEYIGAGAAGEFTGNSLVDFYLSHRKDSTDDCPSDSYQQLLLLRGTSPSTWTAATNIPTDSYVGAAEAADIDNDNRDDFVTIQSDLETGETQVVVYRNIQTYWTRACTPSVAGVNVCQPSQPSYGNSTIDFRVVGSGITGPVRLMQLYVDGRKIGDFPGKFLYTSVPLASGTHRASVVQLEYNRQTYKKNISFVVTGSEICSATPGTLNICSPAASSTVMSPVLISARVNAPRTISGMKVYLDGTLKYSQSSSATSVSTTLTVPVGSHRLEVKAWDVGGGVYSKSENFSIR